MVLIYNDLAKEESARIILNGAYIIRSTKGV